MQIELMNHLKQAKKEEALFIMGKFMQSDDEFSKYALGSLLSVMRSSIYNRQNAVWYNESFYKEYGQNLSKEDINSLIYVFLDYNKKEYGINEAHLKDSSDCVGEENLLLFCQKIKASFLATSRSSMNNNNAAQKQKLVVLYRLINSEESEKYSEQCVKDIANCPTSPAVEFYNKKWMDHEKYF